MEVYTTEVEVVTTTEEVGIGIELDEFDASLLRRVCYFNKTLAKRVAERDGEDAGKQIDLFLSELGDALEEEGIERFDGREE